MNNDNYKKWFIGLAGGFVVIAGVLTSSFYVSYEKVKGELAQTSGELLNAQSQVEDLTKELEESSNAVEETREGYVTVMLQDGEKEDLPGFFLCIAAFFQLLCQILHLTLCV